MGKTENRVEKHLDTGVKLMGGFTRKWTSPGHAGVEDRICFFPCGEVWFIEVKPAGKKPEAHQWREIVSQRMLGHNAGYLAGEKQVNAFLNSQHRDEWMQDHIKQNIDLTKLKQKQVEYMEGLPDA